MVHRSKKLCKAQEQQHPYEYGIIVYPVTMMKLIGNGMFLGKSKQIKIIQNKISKCGWIDSRRMK